jgi:hypothetical protein
LGSGIGFDENDLPALGIAGLRGAAILAAAAASVMSGPPFAGLPEHNQ